MKIEIFVVRSDNEDLKRIEFAKKHLVELFGGLTVIPNCSGVWINEIDEAITDKVEIWQIYTRSFNPSEEKGLKWYMLYIRDATKQTKQLYALNEIPYFI